MLKFIIYCSFVVLMGTSLSAEPTKEEVWSAEHVLSEHVLHELIFAHAAFLTAPSVKTKDAMQQLSLTRLFLYWVYLDGHPGYAVNNTAVSANHRHLKETIKKFAFTEEQWKYPAGIKEIITKLDGKTELNSLVNNRFYPFFPPVGIRAPDQYFQYVKRFRDWTNSD